MFTSTTSFARAFTTRRALFKKHISTTSSASNNKSFNIWKSYLLKSNVNKWSRMNRHNYQTLLSTLETQIASQIPTTTIVSNEERREFLAVFPDIVRNLTHDGKNSDIPEVYKWYAQILQQNVANTKGSRGLVVVATYKMLEYPDNLTPETIRLANILGWCVEMLEAYLLIIDDILDGSETRRREPCWYKRVGLIAINDAQLIKNGAFTVLKSYFSHSPMYLPAVELMHDILQKANMGQGLDVLCLKDGRPDLEAFTMKRFNSLLKYKCFYFICHLPITLGMFLANKFEVDGRTNAILLKLTEFFQIQNDFLDCFGDPESTGKIGSDIQEGKCSWLVVVALQRATPSQKKVIEDNYGKQSPSAIGAIKNLYEELGLPDTYVIYKEDTYNLIKTQIGQLSKDLPQTFFLKFLDVVYEMEYD